MQAAFRDGVIWLSIGQTPELEQRQAQLVRALTGQTPTIGDVQDGRAQLSEATAGANALVILDDVWSMAATDAFALLGGNCRTLITTRDAGISRQIGAVEHDLDILAEPQAPALLAEYAGQPVDDLPPEAAGLLEGLDEVFTIKRLDLPPKLRRCLGTTTIVESPTSGVRLRTRRGAAWKNGSVVLRWAAAAYLQTEKSSRRIIGYQELWTLGAALDRHETDHQERVA